MTLAYEDGRLTLHAGDCMDVMPTFEPDSIDAIVTDPPYGIRFMGKAWDGAEIERSVRARKPRDEERVYVRKDTGKAYSRSSTYIDTNEEAGQYDQSLRGHHLFEEWCETWAREALRVAKPGAYLLSFGGTRTYHRLAAAVEDAGWEIRDCLVWAYAQGFPKSHNLPGGLGTALKPAWEPIVMARKPLRGTVAANVLAFGTAALNIDDTRIPGADGDGHWSGDDGSDATSLPGFDGGFTKGGRADRHGGGAKGSSGFAAGYEPGDGFVASDVGRWPANVMLTDPIFDGETPGVVGGGDQKGGGNPRWRSEEASAKTFGGYETGNPEGYTTGKVPVDTAGTYSRFFLIPKAGRRERNAGLEGLEGLEDRPMLWSSGSQNPGSFQSPNTKRAARNPHPTVKPVELMSHLVRLVTPRGGVVLDPFLGSGSTAIAAIGSGRRCIGIEREAEYLDLVPGRLRLLLGERTEIPA